MEQADKAGKYDIRAVEKIDGAGTKEKNACCKYCSCCGKCNCMVHYGTAGGYVRRAFIAQYGGMHPKLLAGGEWYRLFTAMFVHFGAEHLANNMILLAAAGGKLETEIGHVRYFLIYIGSGLAGNLLSYEVMMRTGDFAVCAGASGAVFGMIGALVWASIRNKGKFQGLTTRGLLFMIALCLYYGITTAGVDNWAHMGGAACGFLLCLFLCKITECLKLLKKIYILCTKK